MNMTLISQNFQKFDSFSRENRIEEESMKPLTIDIIFTENPVLEIYNLPALEIE